MINRAEPFLGGEKRSRAPVTVRRVIDSSITLSVTIIDLSRR